MSDQTKRMGRVAAAAYISETYGFPVGARTLERWPVPYAVLNGRAIYEVAEIDRYARAKIADAPRRIGRVPAAPVALRA